MSIDPFLRDEPPDTRNDAPTRRFEGFLGTYPGDEVPSSGHPKTRAMSQDERLAALAPDTSRSSDLAPPRFALPSADEPEEDDDVIDVTRTLRSERKTLPSPRLTPPPAPPGRVARPTELSWDNPRGWDGRTEPWDGDPEKPEVFPDETPDEAPPSSPSIWGRVQRFVAKFGKKRPSTAPNPLASRERPALRLLMDAVWTMDDGEIDEIAAHLERVVALRRLGADAYTEARILDTLGSLEPDDPEEPGIPLPALREKLPEIPRAALDEALLRLEERRNLTLKPDNDVAERDAVKDRTRGALGRCALRR